MIDSQLQLLYRQLKTDPENKYSIAKLISLLRRSDFDLDRETFNLIKKIQNFTKEPLLELKEAGLFQTKEVKLTTRSFTPINVFGECMSGLYLISYYLSVEGNGFIEFFDFNKAEVLFSHPFHTQYPGCVVNISKTTLKELDLDFHSFGLRGYSYNGSVVINDSHISFARLSQGNKNGLQKIE